MIARAKLRLHDIGVVTVTGSTTELGHLSTYATYYCCHSTIRRRPAVPVLHMLPMLHVTYVVVYVTYVVHM